MFLLSSRFGLKSHGLGAHLRQLGCFCARKIWMPLVILREKSRCLVCMKVNRKSLCSFWALGG